MIDRSDHRENWGGHHAFPNLFLQNKLQLHPIFQHLRIVPLRGGYVPMAQHPGNGFGRDTFVQHHHPEGFAANVGSNP